MAIIRMKNARRMVFMAALMFIVAVPAYAGIEPVAGDATYTAWVSVKIWVQLALLLFGLVDVFAIAGMFREGKAMMAVYGIVALVLDVGAIAITLGAGAVI